MTPKLLRQIVAQTTVQELLERCWTPPGVTLPRSGFTPKSSAACLNDGGNPHVLDFLVQEIQLRLDSGFDAFSFSSLWNYARWKLEVPHRAATYQMNDHLVPLYGRAILILHPKFNGRAECRTSHADEIFGLRLEALDRRRKGYATRLEWADGTSLEQGWKPKTPHTVQHLAATKADIHTR